MKTLTLALAASVLLTSACQSATGSPPATSGATVAVVTSSCHAGADSGQPLPDPHCTPGVTNPAAIHQTICVTGWTATVRPPESYTEPIKRASIRAYGLPANTRGELDHLIPLEAGGSPSDPRNLWIEVGPIPNLKDRVEAAARSAVCAGRMPLAVVQARFEHDWVAFGRQLGVRIP